MAKGACRDVGRDGGGGGSGHVPVATNPLALPVLRVWQAAERRRLLQQQNSERALHKEERLKLIYQVEALMHQVLLRACPVTRMLNPQP